MVAGYINQNWVRFKKPIRYMMISLFATLLDVALLIVLVELINLYYIISATISYLFAVITKFIMNKIFVFRNRPGAWSKQFRKFVTVSINGLILTNIFMYTGVDLLEIGYINAKIITIGIIFIYTATLHNFFSFSKKVE